VLPPRTTPCTTPWNLPRRLSLAVRVFFAVHAYKMFSGGHIGPPLPNSPSPLLQRGNESVSICVYQRFQDSCFFFCFTLRSLRLCGSIFFLSLLSCPPWLRRFFCFRLSWPIDSRLRGNDKRGDASVVCFGRTSPIGVEDRLGSPLQRHLR